MMDTRLYVFALDEFKREILDKAHSSVYAIHLGSTKIYHIHKNFVSRQE